MQWNKLWRRCILSCLIAPFLASCAHQNAPSGSQFSEEFYNELPSFHGERPFSASYNEGRYAEAMPQKVNYGKEKVIVVDPKKFAWAAYDKNGNFVRGGIASAGANYCKDDGHACRTTTGTFRIFSMGEENCVSKEYPVGKGGSLMPYCMFFHNGQSLHGTPDQMFSDANISHGCVHMRIPDVYWVRYHFANVGTKVVVLPYE